MTATAIDVRERPILFSGPMVRAILDGRKTQTRRVVKLAPRQDQRVSINDGVLVDSMSGPIRCPYGVPGDRLWVRESWNITHRDSLAPDEQIGKTVDDCVRDNRGFMPPCSEGVVYAADGVTFHPQYGRVRWKPSIHMPRWASRLTLEITEVRVERLQEIGELDAYAEGVGNKTGCWQHGHDPDHHCRDGRDEYRALWDSLNAKRGYGWDANPWAWVLTFRRDSTTRSGLAHGTEGA